MPTILPCRNFTLEFPFTVSNDPGCGLFVVNGCNDSVSGNLTVSIGGSSGEPSTYAILGKVSRNKLLIQDLGLHAALSNRTCYSFSNMSLPHSPSVSFTFSPNLTFFTCYKAYYVNEGLEKRFQNYNSTDCDVSTMYYKIPAANTRVDAAGDISMSIPPGCVVTQLPLKSENSSGELFDMLSANFSLEWSVSKACNDCYHGGGQCLADNENRFYCKQGGVSIGAFICTSILVFLFTTRKYTLLKLLGYQWPKSAIEKDVELFLKNNGNLAPRRYRYSQLRKMTNSFGELLGKGGYGTVHKGKFPDGRSVAVKILNESKGNGEEFMNEVATISRTSHVNIVTLLGFCIERSKRALIYEFMPNGSLDKFMQSAASSSAQGGLGGKMLLQIALGIARGLEYLHQGCNTRIVHFDIKPHNILLDKDLNPRISDFGLAKLCPNRSSVLSMLVARGTIGYIAPEVFSRNFGEVSYKSDVYSYGMLILEMVGGRMNIDPRDVDHMSEIYFPHYIYKQLEMDAERDVGDLVGTMSEDELVKRNLMIVGLWCIQTNPKDRPSMTKVVEMLEAKLGSLQIPPKPYLYSPPRSAPRFSISESM
ncbi:PR5-like receptor kinase [Perilla frutescens var. hirtella]|uniref:PR5-like receptor kinase n=1 Tax=Perilla frutescens var. hirtella TaxID=608512 RepID=A0AAD4P5J6_PERFH|nr:PR5-like receptor kinase [Perilla frutescens var. hirtella]